MYYKKSLPYKRKAYYLNGCRFMVNHGFGEFAVPIEKYLIDPAEEKAPIFLKIEHRSLDKRGVK